MNKYLVLKKNVSSRTVSRNPSKSSTNLLKTMTTLLTLDTLVNVTQIGLGIWVTSSKVVKVSTVLSQRGLEFPQKTLAECIVFTLGTFGKVTQI